MPRIVDAGQRRKDIVDAVFRVAVRDGLRQASLREVADEAGLVIGSVRHYFDSHEQMLVAAAEAMAEAIGMRVLKHRDRLQDPSESPLAIAEDVLAELLPLDEQRRAEVVTWLEFIVASRTDPALRETAQQLHAGTRQICERIVRRLGVTGRRAGIEAERLAALVDGLAVGAALHPDLLPPATQRATLRAHLTALAALTAS